MAEKRAVVRALVASQARVLAACAEEDRAQSGRLAPDVFCDLLHAAGVQARLGRGRAGASTSGGTRSRRELGNLSFECLPSMQKLDEPGGY